MIACFPLDEIQLCSDKVLITQIKQEHATYTAQSFYKNPLQYSPWIDVNNDQSHTGIYQIKIYRNAMMVKCDRTLSLVRLWFFCKYFFGL